VDNIPELLKNRIDVKAFTFDALCTAIDTIKSGEVEGVSIDAEAKIIIFTNFGIVEGTPISLLPKNSESNTSNIGALYKAIFKARNINLKELESQNENLTLINDASVIVLENAVITPYANPLNKTHSNNLVLFTDQIVGLAIG